MQTNTSTRGIQAVRAETSPAQMLAELTASVADFRTRNDAKITELQAQMAELSIQNAGHQMLGGTPQGGSNYTRELGNAMRKAALGDDSQIRALSTVSDPDGGYLVIPQMDRTVRQIRDIVSPFSGLVRDITLDSGAELLMPYFKGTLPSGWVGEKDARPVTDTVGMGQHRITLHELYANPTATQKLLDTANYDIGQILVDQIAHGLAAAEAEALHTGDGTARPRGFADMPTAATSDASRAFGTVQHVVTGSAGGFGSGTATGKLLDVIAALKPQYRANARWIMSRATASVLWSLKVSATDDRPLWQPSLQEGQPDRLLGYPVTISDSTPEIGTGSLSIWFGDWQQAYTTIRMPGVRLLRDPYSVKGEVAFYAYTRVGGMVTNSEALKVLKFSS